MSSSTQFMNLSRHNGLGTNDHLAKEYGDGDLAAGNGKEHVNGNGHLNGSPAAKHELTQETLTQLHQLLGTETVRELFTHVRQIERLHGVNDPESLVIRDEKDRPYLKKGVPAKLLYATDCYDSETRSRLIARFGSIDPYRVHNLEGSILPTESLNQHHLSAVFTSYYYERLQMAQEKFSDPDPVLFLANAAPRAGNNPKGVGTCFVFAELQNNVYYFGTFGPELSRVKDHIKCLHEVDIEHQNAKTSFRSRFLPEIAARWLEHDSSVFRSEIDKNLIPAIEPETVYSIDNFGNIKLNFTGADDLYKQILAAGRVEVAIGEGSPFHPVKVGANLGDAKDGELILTVGTSKLGPEDDQYGVIIYRQSKSAAEKFSEFAKVAPGEKVRINTYQ